MKTEAELIEQLTKVRGFHARERERYRTAQDFNTVASSWHSMMRYEAQITMLRWSLNLPREERPR